MPVRVWPSAPEFMMISQQSIDDQIDDTEWLIEYVIETVLSSIPNREAVLSALNDLIYFEKDLQRLREIKKNDRNN